MGDDLTAAVFLLSVWVAFLLPPPVVRVYLVKLPDPLVCSHTLTFLCWFGKLENTGVTLLRSGSRWRGGQEVCSPPASCRAAPETIRLDSSDWSPARQKDSAVGLGASLFARNSLGKRVWRHV